MTDEEARKATHDPGKVQVCGMVGMRVGGGMAETPTAPFIAPFHITPDVPRGQWWNYKGTAMVGYWDLLDAYNDLLTKLPPPAHDVLRKEPPE